MSHVGVLFQLALNFPQVPFITRHVNHRSCTHSCPEQQNTHHVRQQVFRHSAYLQWAGGEYNTREASEASFSARPEVQAWANRWIIQVNRWFIQDVQVTRFMITESGTEKGGTGGMDGNEEWSDFGALLWNWSLLLKSNVDCWGGVVCGGVWRGFVKSNVPTVDLAWVCPVIRLLLRQLIPVTTTPTLSWQLSSCLVLKAESESTVWSASERDWHFSMNSAFHPVLKRIGQTELCIFVDIVSVWIAPPTIPTVPFSNTSLFNQTVLSINVTSGSGHSNYPSSTGSPKGLLELAERTATAEWHDYSCCLQLVLLTSAAGSLESYNLED